MPVAKPVIVVFNVDPGMAPGLMVQFPAGSPLNSALPVDTAHVGWVIVPTKGAVGVTGCALMTILADAVEVHPAAFVTV